MTIIDPSKVHLQEIDIEDWLWENPQCLQLGRGTNLVHWVARQMKVPSGIVDLVGIGEYAYGTCACLFVVEVKNVPINAAALTQVSRYAADIKRICMNQKDMYEYSNWDVAQVVVGPSIEDNAWVESQALGITVNTFNVELSLGVSMRIWNRDYFNEREDRGKEIAESNDFFDEFLNVTRALAEERERVSTQEQPDAGDYDVVAEFEEAIKNVAEKNKEEKEQ